MHLAILVEVLGILLKKCHTVLIMPIQLENTVYLIYTMNVILYDYVILD